MALFFGAVPFSQTSSLLTWALKRGLCLAVSFKPQADCVDWDWKWPLLCFGGWKLKCRVAVLEASRAFFPPERKRNLACQSWQFLSSFAVRTKLSLWVGLPSCAFRKTEETNLSVLLAMNPKSPVQDNWKKWFYCAIMKQKLFFSYPCCWTAARQTVVIKSYTPNFRTMTDGCTCVYCDCTHAYDTLTNGCRLLHLWKCSIVLPE